LDAAAVLGIQIATARRERRWTLANLAERAGITVVTLRKIENGDLSVSIGTYFEVATLLGFSLHFRPKRSPHDPQPSETAIGARAFRVRERDNEVSDAF